MLDTLFHKPLLWLLLLSISSTTRGFPLSILQRSRRCSLPRHFSTATMSVPNWRILQIQDREASNASILQDREVWNEYSYEEALDLYDRFLNCPDGYVAGHIEEALSTLDHAYRLYGPESVICSFNGGKDAVVILHLVRVAHAHHYRQQRQQQPGTRIIRPRVIYFDHKDEFTDIVEFLHEAVDQYDLDMIMFEQGVKFPQGLQVLVQNNRCAADTGNNNSGTATIPLAFVLGTRTSDPNAGKQGHFAPSSHYMPPFMRVNPILDWTYGHVWHFLRLFQLPYCSLYDQGYTSLGTTKDTLPCPALAVAGSQNSSVPKYWPAYMLRDWDQERAGRIPKVGKTKPPPLDESENSGGDILSRASSMGHLSSFSVFKVAPTGQQQSRETDLSVQDDKSWVSDSSEIITQKTVGLLIIGNEILKGYTPDTNTQAAAKALCCRNVWLKRVVVVPDELDEIVHEIERLQEDVDVIITSGGVGPTHDDVTIKSVAAALDCELGIHEEMARLLRDKMNEGKPDAELSEAQIKMATLPKASKLRYLSNNPRDWPVLQCRNVFVLPGIPEFFAKKIDDVAEYLSCQLERGKAYKVVLSVDENSIVPLLNRVVENHPEVSFGSYPFVSHPEYKTVITVEARLISKGRSNSVIFERSEIDKSRSQMDNYVDLALDDLITTLPSASILRVDNDDMLLYS